MIAGSIEIQLMANMARLAKDMNDAKKAVTSAMDDIASYVKKTAGLLGVAFTGKMFVDFIEGAISAAAALQHLHERTGASVESLSGLKAVAKLSGTDMDAVGVGLAKLAKNMLETAQNSGTAKGAFAALGLSVRDSSGQLKDNGAFMQEVAVALDQMQNGTQRAAYAQLIFGKSGAALLPMLHDLAAAGELHGRVTAEQAEQADIFEKNLARLRTGINAAYTDIAGGMLPTLNDLADLLLQTKKQTEGVTAATRELAQDGSVEDWSRRVAIALAYVMDVLQAATLYFKQLPHSLAVIANDIYTVAQLAEIAVNPLEFFKLDKMKQVLAERRGFLEAAGEDFDKLIDSYSSNVDRLEKIFEQKDPFRPFNAHEQQYLAQSVAAQKAYAGQSLEIQRYVQQAYANAFMQSSSRSVPMVDEEAVKKAKNAYDELIKSLREKIAVQRGEIDGEDKLSESGAAYAKFLADVTGGTLKLAPAQMAVAASYWDTYLKLAQLNKEREVEDKSLAERQAKASAAFDANEREIQGIVDSTVKLREENENLAAGAEALDMLKIKRIDDAIAREHQTLAILDALPQDSAEIQQIRDKIAALEDYKRALGENITATRIKEARDQWKQLTNDVKSSLTDSIMRGLEGGKNGFKDFFDSLKRAAKATVIRVGVDMIMNPIMNAAGQAGGVSLLQAGSSLFSAGSNLLGGGSGSGDIAKDVLSAFGWSDMPSLGTAIGNLSTIIPTFSTALESGAGLIDAASAAFAGTASSFAALVPWVGGALAIGSALGLFGGKKEDPHNNADSKTLAVKLGLGGATAPTGYQNVGWPASWVVSGKTSGSGRWAEHPALDQATLTALNQATQAVFDSGRKLADILGVDANALNSVSVEGETFKDANDALGQLSDQIALKLIPNVADFQQQGETLGQTATRVASDIQGVDQAMKLMGISLNLVGDAATRAATVERIVAAGGGSQAFAANLSGFMQNYYTDAERQAQATAALHEQFVKLGIEMPATKDEFRALVEALSKSGEAGQVMAAKVLTMQDSFAKVADSAEASAKQILDSYKQLVDSLKSESDQLSAGDLSPLTGAQKYAAMKSAVDAIWQQAATGDQAALEQLPKALTDWLTASRGMYASGDLYMRDYASARGMLSQAQAIAATNAMPKATGAYDTGAAIASAQAQAAATAQSQTSSAPNAPWPDGSFVRDPSTLQVFHVEQGLLRWLPSPSIAESVFGAAWHNAPNFADAANLWAQEGSLHIPGYATGLDFVPYDNFIARLHYGERVQTAAEAAGWRTGDRGISGSDLASLQEELRGVRQDLGKVAATIARGDAENVKATVSLAETQRDIAHRADVKARLR